MRQRNKKVHVLKTKYQVQTNNAPQKHWSNPRFGATIAFSSYASFSTQKQKSYQQYCHIYSAFFQSTSLFFKELGFFLLLFFVMGHIYVYSNYK